MADTDGKIRPGARRTIALLVLVTALASAAYAAFQYTRGEDGLALVVSAVLLGAVGAFLLIRRG